MKLETLHKVEKLVLFLLIITLPLNSIPKSYVLIPQLGGNLPNYFFLIGMALLFYEWYVYRFKIEVKAKIFILTYVIWQVACLLTGLIFYEYNELLNLSQIPTLEKLLMILGNYGVQVNEMIAIKGWLFLRYLKSIFIFNNTLFFLLYYVFHLYKDNFEQGFKDTRKACLSLAVIMGAYSIVELLWLKLSLTSAGNFLKIVNPYLYDVVQVHGWWPPLLWNGQLRSITREPSFFGILSVFIIPFLWSLLFEKRYKIFSSIFIFYYTFMIAATNARTAIVVALVELFLFLISCLFVRKKEYFVKVFVIVIITAAAFLINLVDFRNFHQDDAYISSSAVMYIEKNVTSVAKTDVRSNSARLANLIANINVIKQHPFTGVGTGLKDAYIDANLPEFSYSNWEVRNWSRYMRNEGVLRMGYPALNKYADVAVHNGLVGLTIYMLIPFYIIYYVLKNIRTCFSDYRFIMLLISMGGLLAVQLSNAGFTIPNGIIWGLLLCKIEEINKAGKG